VPHFVQGITPNLASNDVNCPGSPSPYGLSPAQIRDAYGVGAISFNGMTGNGAGQTIAIVDAYDDPAIATDLHNFDQYYGLPDPPSFEKLNQNGGKSLPGTDPAGPFSTTGCETWEQEESLDVEWAHVIAPEANIILFEASDDDTGLFAAVATARKTAGVTVVSMSWGGSEFSGESSDDSKYFTTPANHIGAGGVPGGITFVASTGDSGAYDPDTGAMGVQYPACSPDVLAVGGTTLNISGNAYVSESGWECSGGGISTQESQPIWQKGIVTQSSTMRTIPDVSMDADPFSGVPVFDSWDFGSSTPWFPGYEGGTSLSAPMWAGIIAIADQGRATAGLGSLDGATQTLPSLYKLPSSDFHDVTTGNNGYAAGKGYDLVTGRGTPVANTLVPGLAGVITRAPAATRPVIAGLKASPKPVKSGKLLTLTASGVTDPAAGNGIKSVVFYRESNGVPGLQTTGSHADKLVGTATLGSGGSWSVTISTAGLAAGTSTFYALATDKAGLAGAPVSTTIVVTPAGTAAYIGTDYMTEGNWKGKYGSQGEYIVNDSKTLPSYATLTTSGNATTYESSSGSFSALERKSTGRIASAVTGLGSVSLGLDLTDGQVHRVDVYVLDWNGENASSEKVAVFDASTGAVLSSETVSGYSLGKYVAFDITGNVTIMATSANGRIATVSGLFLDH